MSRISKFQSINTRRDHDVLCDRCGGSCVMSRHKFDGLETIYTESAQFTAQWGYGSVQDGDNWAAELCQDCAKKIFDFIEEGDGLGVDLNFDFGDLTQYGLEGIKKKLERVCQEDVGMGSEEFLSYVAKSEVPENVPSSCLSYALLLSKFYLKYKDIPEEHWFFAHLDN